MNKPDPIDLTLQANAWTAFREFSDGVDRFNADLATFRRKLETAILSTREAGSAEKAPGQQ